MTVERSYSERMIPTMILFGFVLGRWWKVTVPLAAVAWPLLLLADGIHLDRWEAIEAAFLGAANAAVGAAGFLAVAGLARMALRSIRRS
jgi:hypothetical protein